MLFKNIPIRKKLLKAIFLVNGIILLVTCVTFFIYEFYIFRKSTIEKLSTIGKIISINSEAALAFRDRKAAKEILAALKTERHIVAACIYDKDGKIFSQYPVNTPIIAFPAKPGAKGYLFSDSYLEGFEPVVQGTVPLGILYLKSDLGTMYERFRLYGIIVSLVIIITFLLAYLLSKILQKSISDPILTLAETAKTICANGDYSVRAVKSGDDELGPFTDSFNVMLQQIQDQSNNLKEFNQKLDKSEKLFRAMIEKDADMKTLLTPAGKVLYASSSLTKILGYENQEFMNLPAFDLIHPDNVPELFEGITDIVQTPGKSFYHQQRLKHKNGTWLWCEGTITNMLHEPAVAALVSNFRDITERKKLEEQQALFVSIVSSSDDAIVSKTLDGKITSWNPGAEKAFGYSSNEIIGKHISILIPLHLQNEEKEIMEQIRKGESIDHYETERIKKDGEAIYVSLTISPVQDSLGNIIGASKIARNITERKKAEDLLIKSEKQYRYLFENSPIPMWVIDLNTFEFLDVNEIAILQYGYSREEFLSMTTLDIRPDKDKELFIQSGHLLEMTKANYSKGIWNHSKKDGTIIHVETIGHKIIFKGVPARLILSNDVTERIMAEGEIQKLNDELENRVKQRTEELEAFSYSVSHDLRAPLRAVNGYARILEEDYKKVFDKEGNRLLWVIQENAKKMGILIDDLLAFSKLGKQDVNRSLINMTGLSENIFTEMNKTISNNVKIKIGPLYELMADYSLINLVMTNLISNAIKYSSQKEIPSIEIKSEKKDGELIYSVSDNGSGFDMKYVHKLFGVFQRLHSVEEFEGTGVGLAIVKRIISKHNGRVWAEGKPGKGATFYFSLPDYQTN